VNFVLKNFLSVKTFYSAINHQYEYQRKVSALNIRCIHILCYIYLHMHVYTLYIFTYLTYRNMIIITALLLTNVLATIWHVTLLSLVSLWFRVAVDLCPNEASCFYFNWSPHKVTNQFINISTSWAFSACMLLKLKAKFL
jgi:hypothetical protein